MVFSDADQVAQANLMSCVTQVSPGVAAQSAQASNVAVSMFDDDLDLGAPSTAAGPNRYPCSSAESHAMLQCSALPVTGCSLCEHSQYSVLSVACSSAAVNKYAPQTFTPVCLFTAINRLNASTTVPIIMSPPAVEHCW